MPKSAIRFPRFTSSGWPDWRQAWYVLQPGGFATGCCGFCCRWRRFFSSVCFWKSTPRMSVLRCIGSRGLPIMRRPIWHLVWFCWGAGSVGAGIGTTNRKPEAEHSLESAFIQWPLHHHRTRQRPPPVHALQCAMLCQSSRPSSLSNPFSA